MCRASGENEDPPSREWWEEKKLYMYIMNIYAKNIFINKHVLKKPICIYKYIYIYWKKSIYIYIYTLKIYVLKML